MAEIITKRKIAVLGERELRYTEINGETKFDIRKWNGNEPGDGVRFSADELEQICYFKFYKFPDKTIVLDTDKLSWTVQITHNGKLYVREIATMDEFSKLCEICNKAEGMKPVPFEFALLSCAEKTTVKKEEKPKAKAKAETKTKTTTTTKAKAKPKKTYTNGYERFKDMVDEFINGEPENRRPAYKSTWNLVLARIKEKCENDDIYNQACLQESKTSYGMAKFCMEKQFENYDCHDYEQQCENLKTWVDEYITTEDTEKKAG